jgi:hypothetical protein
MRELRHPIDPQAHAARLKQVAGQVFGSWCKLVKQTS